MGSVAISAALSGSSSIMARKNVAEILTNQVTLELQAIDRMVLNAYVPSLQTGGGFVYFVKSQLGARVPSTTPTKPPGFQRNAIFAGHRDPPLVPGSERTRPTEGHLPYRVTMNIADEFTRSAERLPPDRPRVPPASRPIS